MGTSIITSLLTLTCLLVLSSLLVCGTLEAAAQTYYPGPAARVVPSAPPPGLPPSLTLSPYNTGENEINLWRIEAEKVKRSVPVLSPKGTGYCYTEVIYLPGQRQWFSTLYYVPLYSNWGSLGEALRQQPQGLAALLTPEKTLSLRQPWWRVGDNPPTPYAFNTLTPLDWSPNGQRLLIKQRQGVAYTGLVPTRLAMADRAGDGRIIVFGELLQAVKAYWQGQPLFDGQQLALRAWDLQPLGWVPGSNQLVLVKAWAFSQKNPPVFLGLWRFNVETRQPQLLSTQLEDVPSVAANGWTVAE